MSQTLDDTGRLDTMITELSVHLWGPKSSSLYHTKSEIKKLAEAYAIQELEKLKENTTNPKGEWKYGIVAIQYIEAAINRLKGEHDKSND